MPEDYAHGRRDGLRMALAILQAEEAKWDALLGESRSWRTNAIREVRYKALRVAQQRINDIGKVFFERIALLRVDACGGVDTVSLFRWHAACKKGALKKAVRALCP